MRRVCSSASPWGSKHRSFHGSAGKVCDGSWNPPTAHVPNVEIYSGLSCLTTPAPFSLIYQYPPVQPLAAGVSVVSWFVGCGPGRIVIWPPFTVVTQGACVLDMTTPRIQATPQLTSRLPCAFFLILFSLSSDTAKITSSLPKQNSNGRASQFLLAGASSLLEPSFSAQAFLPS